ncbi:GTP pyrophosphokinase [Anaerotignum faecicola]
MELNKVIDLEALTASGFPEGLIEQASGFMELMMQYRCALMEVETKLNVLNAEFTMKNNRNPFESIKSRIKTPKSILEKLQRKGFEISVKGIEENLADVAGIRVICSFPDDIYATAKMLTDQDDIRVIQVKDYIINPKSNGYRSLHLILEVPIFLSNEKKNMKVEVQFRTIAMDFWASLEHKLKYKKNIENAEEISKELQRCAEASSQLDLRMQALRDRIEAERE